MQRTINAQKAAEPQNGGLLCGIYEFLTRREKSRFKCSLPDGDAAPKMQGKCINSTQKLANEIFSLQKMQAALQIQTEKLAFFQAF